MLGINSWSHKPGELQKVMQRENIPWRTFDDGGEINRLWNQPATPAFYIIDHQGVIRRQWIGKPGARAIDKALDKAIKEAQR